MAVPEVSPYLLYTAFLPPTTGVESVTTTVGGQRRLSSGDLFTAAFALYLGRLHQLVMQSWEQYSESLKAQAKEQNETHRFHQRQRADDEATRTEGQRRQIEALLKTPAGEILLDAAHRQAGKFRFHDGFRGNDEGRHLFLPV